MPGRRGIVSTSSHINMAENHHIENELMHVKATRTSTCQHSSRICLAHVVATCQLHGAAFASVWLHIPDVWMPHPNA